MTVDDIKKGQLYRLRDFPNVIYKVKDVQDDKIVFSNGNFTHNKNNFLMVYELVEQQYAKEDLEGMYINVGGWEYQICNVKGVTCDLINIKSPTGSLKDCLGYSLATIFQQLNARNWFIIPGPIKKLFKIWN